jgi:hypothetical protein
MSRTRTLLCLVCAVLCGACAEPERFSLVPSQHIEHPEDAGTMIADEPVASQPGTEPPFVEPGWSTRGALPYARLGHSAVFDSDRERMLVFGGNANDVWALELAGDRAGTWSQVAVRGGFPPVHSYSTTFILPSFADAAVYVPERQSMIVVLNPEGISEPAVWHAEVWELSFKGPEPAWSKLATLEAADAREIHSAAAVYDPRGQRVLMLGGMLHDSALWALELAGETPRWSRIASAPGEPDTFYNGHSLVLDPGRNRVLLGSCSTAICKLRRATCPRSRSIRGATSSCTSAAIKPSRP